MYVKFITGKNAPYDLGGYYFMKKKSLLFKILAMALFVVMLMSMLASCGGFNNNGGGGGGDKPQPEPAKVVKRSDIKALANLEDYAKAGAYNAKEKTYSDSDKKYDGKDCTEQYNMLQNRIDKKTEDVYLGKTEAAATKIFTKSTPDGILGAIAKAALTFDEMKRVVKYLAGDSDVDADIDSFVKEDEVRKSWSGTLVGNSSTITLWEEAGSDGKDLNEGWSFFDDWDLYDRLKDYSKSSYNGLAKGREKVLNDIGTQEIANDNASWQYRSILEKIYKPASQGGVDIDGASAARLATYLLEYATAVSEGMSGGTITEAAAIGNTSAFSVYFRTPIKLPVNIPSSYDSAKTFWDPYRSLGDYDVLSYLLSFNDFYKVKGFGTMTGLQSCAQLYGYYYQYNRTYYNVVLSNRETYKNQLYYEKLDTYTDEQWLDYVKIQRKNYTGSYRYSDSFYQGFYAIHFNFQGRKETAEKTVYEISDSISGHTYTGEMIKAIDSTKNGIKGQLAMSDEMWCYSGVTKNMTSYNKANTDYQKGKQKGAEEEYKGRFYYELEQLNIAEHLLTNMTNEELSGALYYNCYGYSGSLISEMQGYAKDIVLIEDDIKGWDKFTKIPTGIRETNEDAYAIGKLGVLKEQAKYDWNEKDISDQASLASKQSWGSMRTELSDAKKYNYMSLTAESAGDYTNVWRKRCDYLEDRVIARNYSCCGQRISEATEKCPTDHGKNPDGTAMTKEYSEKCAISKFVSDYENVLYYIAAKAKVEFKVAGKSYVTDSNAEVTYTAGYYGDIATLYSNSKNKNIYDSEKTFTVSIGSTFKDDIIDEDGDDAKWWNENKNGSANVTDYGPYLSNEEYSNQKVPFNYIYTFKGWFLDEKCMYEFIPDDDIDFNLRIFAGYDVKKEKVN